MSLFDTTIENPDTSVVLITNPAGKTKSVLIPAVTPVLIEPQIEVPVEIPLISTPDAIVVANTCETSFTTKPILLRDADAESFRPITGSDPSFNFAANPRSKFKWFHISKL